MEIFKNYTTVCYPDKISTGGIKRYQGKCKLVHFDVFHIFRSEFCLWSSRQRDSSRNSNVSKYLAGWTFWLHCVFSVLTLLRQSGNYFLSPCSGTFIFYTQNRFHFVDFLAPNLLFHASAEKLPFVRTYITKQVSWDFIFLADCCVAYISLWPLNSIVV